jgi:3-oxoacid CoA-transferase subunit A
MIEHWLITGDTHRMFSRFKYLDKTPNTGIIILGDVGLNYTLDEDDHDTKRALCKQYPYDFYCVRGNHEARPSDVPGMELWYDENVRGWVWMEEEFPRIKYFQDWGFYEIDGLTTLVIGGAYSVDKYWRINREAKWFKNEQLNEMERNDCLRFASGRKFDLVLMHTCPLSLQPTDMFLRGLDQSTVDNTMEVWLEELVNSIEWKLLLFGHYHADRIEWPHVEQFYMEMEPLMDIVERWKKYDETGKLDWWIPTSPKMKRLMESE